MTPLSCSPDAQGFLQKLEKEERQKRDGVDNRSFLQKYVSWLEVLKPTMRDYGYGKTSVDPPR